MAKETLRMTLDELAVMFAEEWSEGRELVAVGVARLCTNRWNELYLPTIHEKIADGGGEWPWPGCPEADEAAGWEGWYGDNGRTGP